MRDDGGGGGHRRSNDDTSGGVYLLGCLILLFEGAQVAVYCLVQTKLLAPPINATPILVTTWSYVFATPMTICIVFFNVIIYSLDNQLNSFGDLGNIFTNDDIKPMLGLAYALMFASIVGYWLWGVDVANQTPEASELILYQAVQLPVTATMSVLLLGESLQVSMLFGSIFIFGALVLKSPTIIPLGCLDPPPTPHESEVDTDVSSDARARTLSRDTEHEANALMTGEHSALDADNDNVSDLETTVQLVLQHY